MRAIFVVVIVTVFGTVLTAEQTRRQTAQPETLVQQDNLRSKRSYERWLDIISQYARRGSDGANSLQPFPIDLPIVGKDGKHTSLPLLVLPIPVPVPVPDGKQECNANTDSNSYKESNSRYKDEYNRYRGDNNRYRGDNNRYRDEEINNNRYREDEIRFKENTYSNKEYDYDVRSGNGGFKEGYESFIQKQSESVSSDYLVEVFKKQQPTAPELPPALIGYAPEITDPVISNGAGGRGYPQNNRQYLPPSRDEYLPPARDTPSPPKFDRSMMMKAFLTVHKADYTEAYTVRYDARSGSSRVDYHEGGTTCYRTMMSDRRVKRSMIYTDRTEDNDVVVCGVTTPSRASSEDREAPALPNTEGFSFAGYKQEYNVRAEVWQRELKGREGELGAARGEALVYRHELLVHKRDDGFSVPLRYRVAVDSSVLGPNCDGYEHIYSEVREKEHEPDDFDLNTDRQCDTVNQMNTNNPEDMARLDPIREFTMPSRDPRFDTNFGSYLKEFERKYADEKEEAIRRNLFVQHSRFITSCNRQSATFSLELNFLSDRLDEELESILGVSFSEGAENNTEIFPLSEARLIDEEDSLPKEFDWRPKGAVSSVKFQGVSCSSCWAFAVAGSVEGALFIKTNQFVELSVQCLVDCAISHGAHGCNKIGTWPVHAFNYVKDRGLPAMAEYGPYDAKDHKCKAPPTPPVTHIQGGADVPPNNIEALKVAIRRFAPSVIVVDARPQTFISYKKGVLRDDRCIKTPKKKLNHAILAVGWGERKGAPHFIMKNSWSEAWGDKGYIRLHAPSNTCGHLTTPSFAILRESDVDRLPGARTGDAGDAGGAGARQGRARGSRRNRRREYKDQN